jgi:hypothetical protein
MRITTRCAGAARRNNRIRCVPTKCAIPRQAEPLLCMASMDPGVEAAGLSVIFVYGDAPECAERDHFYYIGIVRCTDTPPHWGSPAG